MEIYPTYVKTFLDKPTFPSATTLVWLKTLCVALYQQSEYYQENISDSHSYTQQEPNLYWCKESADTYCTVDYLYWGKQ